MATVRVRLTFCIYYVSTEATAFSSCVTTVTYLQKVVE